jgi:hypothetical protein
VVRAGEAGGDAEEKAHGAACPLRRVHAIGVAVELLRRAHLEQLLPRHVAEAAAAAAAGTAAGGAGSAAAAAKKAKKGGKAAAAASKKAALAGGQLPQHLALAMSVLPPSVANAMLASLGLGAATSGGAGGSSAGAAVASSSSSAGAAGAGTAATSGLAAAVPLLSFLVSLGLLTPAQAGSLATSLAPDFAGVTPAAAASAGLPGFDDECEWGAERQAGGQIGQQAS